MMKASLKVLQVLPYYYPAHRYGGPVGSVHGLSRQLVKLGVDVTVFTTNIDGPQDLTVPLEREVLLDGVRVVYFPVGRPRFYVRSAEFAAAVSTRVDEFDLVHIHGLYLYPTLVSSRLCRQRAIPYIVAPRGMLDPYAIRGKSSFKKRLYLWLFERRNLDGAAALHFTSTEEQRLAAVLGIRSPGFVVPNGLTMAEFPDKQPASSPNGMGRNRTIVFLGRIDAKKGLDLLVPAFARVVAAQPKAQLLLAGPDDRGYLSEVKGLIGRHGLQSSVSYAGMLLGEEKLEALRSAALLVLPSYSENFGMVVIEALACRTPVVITERVNIHREIVKAGAGLVTPCEVEALAGAMLYLLQNPDEARAMGTRGRTLIEERFSWENVAQAMMVEYEQVLARPR
jgi:glycosyltransferase involved in cell wall biosynthesis